MGRQRPRSWSWGSYGNLGRNTDSRVEMGSSLLSEETSNSSRYLAHPRTILDIHGRTGGASLALLVERATLDLGVVDLKFLGWSWI